MTRVHFNALKIATIPNASSLLIFLEAAIKYCLNSTSDISVNIAGITTHGLAITATMNMETTLNCNYSAGTILLQYKTLILLTVVYWYDSYGN